MRFVKPLDTACILQMASQHRMLVTIEDNAIAGGAGSAVCEFIASQGISIPTLILGIPDQFIEHANREEQLLECGLDADSIFRKVQRELTSKIATLRAVD